MFWENENAQKTLALNIVKGKIIRVNLMKGISPLLAAILLIAIAVLVAGIISTWFIELTKSSQSTITNQTSGQVECGILEIEDVYLDFDTNVTRILISTSGDFEYINTVGVYNTNGEAAPNVTEMPVNISRGQIKTIIYNITNIMTHCDNFSQVIIPRDNCIDAVFDRMPKGC